MNFADVTLPKYAAYTQQQWTDLIRNERRIELAGEGRRYDDIIRWRIAGQVLNQPALGHTRIVNGEKVSLKIEDRAFRPNNYLWPFHENSLKVEPGLRQNEGYQYHVSSSQKGALIRRPFFICIFLILFPGNRRTWR